MESTNKKQSEEPREIATVDDSMRRENDVEESKELTIFADQSHEIQVDVPASVEEVPNPYIFQGLKEFLERPVPIETFTWPLSSTFGSCLKRLIFPDALFALPFFWEKLRHFQYFRGGLHFRVKINATLYHYGKLLMVWRPMALAKTTTGYGATQTAGAYDNIYTLSTYPNIQVSPNSSETQEMQVSFFLPYQWIDLLVFGTTTGATEGHSLTARYLMNMGVLEFWVLTPLQASGVAGDPPASVSVYANFTNVELAGYTPMVITYEPQEIGALSGVRLPTGFNWNDVVLPIAQSGRITNNEASAKEGLWKVSVMPMQIASADVDLPLIPLGAKENAGSSSLAEGMPSIEEYLRVPNLLARLRLSSTVTAGSLLARIPVTPNLYPINGTTIFPTRLSFIAKLFSFWKGELEYHFQVVCSKFHSFRFRVYWTPYASTTSSLPYVSNTVNKVVDVQGETNFSIQVPWLQRSPQLRVNTNRDSLNGLLMVDLLNPLVYPTTPIPQVYINIWVSASKMDLEKLDLWSNAVPNRRILLPAEPPRNLDDQVEKANKQKTDKIAKALLDKLPHVQSGAFDPEAQGKKGPIQGKELCPPETVKIVGEKITTFSSIAKKPSKIAVVPNNQRLWYTPFCLNTAGTGGRQFYSLLEYLQLIFVGYSGSVEFWVPQSCDVFFIPWTTTNHYYDIKTSTMNFQTLLNEHSHEHIAYFEDVGSGAASHRAVALPFYSTLIFKPFMLFGTVPSSDESIGFPGLDIHIRDAADSNTYVLVRGGGDFTFHFALGPPMLQPVTSNRSSLDSIR